MRGARWLVRLHRAQFAIEIATLRALPDAQHFSAQQRFIRSKTP
jgi:hypothetical protein